MSTDDRAPDEGIANKRSPQTDSANASRRRRSPRQQVALRLDELMPGETEIRGLLVLLLVTDARRATRTDTAGRLVRLEDQDRSAWDRAALAGADAMIVGCLGGQNRARGSRAARTRRAAVEVPLPARDQGRPAQPPWPDG